MIFRYLNILEFLSVLSFFNLPGEGIQCLLFSIKSFHKIHSLDQIQKIQNTKYKIPNQNKKYKIQNKKLFINK